MKACAHRYGKGVVEFVGGHFHDGLVEMGEGRVVDEYMDGAVPFRHPPEGLADGLGLSQVGLDEANTVRQGFVLFHVESRDRIPRALEAFAKVKPYAACAARDDACPHAAPLC